jgi:hypothetical protein
MEGVSRRRLPMPPQVTMDLLKPFDPQRWPELPTVTQVILAMAVFLMGAAIALSLILWVLRSN